MTDATDTTIDAIAHKAVSTPDDLTSAERVRLGAWIVDRREQVAAHYEHIREANAASKAPASDLGATQTVFPRPRKADPSERLAAQDPTKQIEHETETTT